MVHEGPDFVCVPGQQVILPGRKCNDKPMVNLLRIGWVSDVLESEDKCVTYTMLLLLVGG